MREEFIDFFSLSKKKEGRKENNKFLLTLKNRKLINICSNRNDGRFFFFFFFEQ